MHVNRTGIYKNVLERRWEYWVVESEKIKIMVSWISWNTSQNELEKWKKRHLLEDVSYTA
ncbi:hypothetical protein [Pseudalkalibacillus caeni]|uniref:Uncharacterized protein n=1 Tax=Exobacillus caeni TaxID=2574798 RepID=A0A5R9FC52_9BACL|nr:hypothetical protein [Pseudalkalibacillus caeni]TLS38134.1 hypothetical protein FCL54_06230 [Pseudalkalibacillus caeni]